MLHTSRGAFYSDTASAVNATAGTGTSVTEALTALDAVCTVKFTESSEDYVCRLTIKNTQAIQTMQLQLPGLGDSEAGECSGQAVDAIPSQTGATACPSAYNMCVPWTSLLPCVLPSLKPIGSMA